MSDNYQDQEADAMPLAGESCECCGVKLTEFDRGYMVGMADAQRIIAEEFPEQNNQREFVATATVQIVLRDTSETDARIAMAEYLDEFIEQCSDARNDPMNGRVVNGVVEL